MQKRRPHDEGVDASQARQVGEVRPTQVPVDDRVAESRVHVRGRACSDRGEVLLRGVGAAFADERADGAVPGVRPLGVVTNGRGRWRSSRCADAVLSATLCTGNTVN